MQTISLVRQNRCFQRVLTKGAAVAEVMPLSRARGLVKI
jgi:hypothetical protein